MRTNPAQYCIQLNKTKYIQNYGMKIIDASVMPVGAVRYAINSTVSNQFWLYKVLGHLTTNMIGKHLLRWVVIFGGQLELAHNHILPTVHKQLKSFKYRFAHIVTVCHFECNVQLNQLLMSIMLKSPFYLIKVHSC